MNWFFNDWSIQNKFRGIIFLLSIFFALLITITLLINESFVQKRNIAADLHTISDIMGINSSVGLFFDDEQAVENTLVSLQAKSNIIIAYVFNKEGELFAAYCRANCQPEQLPTSLKLLLEEEAYDASIDADNIHKNLSFFIHEHIDVYHPIIIDGQFIGTVYIQADLQELTTRLVVYTLTISIVIAISLLLTLFLAANLQHLFTKPIYQLLGTISAVAQKQDYSVRTAKTGNDEFGQLIDGFNHMLAKIQQRDEELAHANQEISHLNHQLKAENRRMSAELDIAQTLQQLVLPRQSELDAVAELDIAAYMEPADEVGGDYYDVLAHEGQVVIGIGDVTGHGLESGVLMIMVQTAVRALLTSNTGQPKDFLRALNSTIYQNVSRMSSDKNLTIALLDYKSGKLRFSGQHEELLLVRQNGQIESIDTMELGFIVGIVDDITEYIQQVELDLQQGDGVVLYTDGITEAFNQQGKQYGLTRLCETISQHWQQPAANIKNAVIADVRAHIGQARVYDDITLLVLKQVA